MLLYHSNHIRPHYYLVTLLSRLISSPVRLLTRYLLHLSYDWSLCLAQLTPACGVTSFRFIQAATAHHHQHSVALLPLLATGTYHSLLLTVFFLPRSLNHCASACHSSINRLSSLHPSFNCCAYSALFSDLLARHRCRWCRIRTCGVPHIPDTCVPAFVHSANHLSVYLIVSPRRSPSCTMRSNFIFG